jgi:hypothetical protein
MLCRRQPLTFIPQLARNQVAQDGLARHVRVLLHNGLECRQIGRRIRRFDGIVCICFIGEPRVQKNALAERRNGRQRRVQPLRVLRLLNGLGAPPHLG